jgi:hypothetical protein
MTEPTAAPVGDTGAQAAPAQSAENSSWYSSYDTDTVGWLENRGLTKLDSNAAMPEVIKGFRNAEKYIGTPAESLIKIPKADAPDDAWNEVYTKLGRPQDPKEYALSVPDGVDPSFAEWAKGTFHELGVTKTQGEKLSAKWNDYVSQQVGSQEQQYKTQVADQTNKLKAEWGQAFDQNVNIAKRAAQEFGVDSTTIDKMESAMGFDGVMKFFQTIGSKIGEHSYESGEAQGFNGAMTPNAAQSRIRQLQNDGEFVKKYIAGNVDARGEMERLHKLAYQ